MGWWTDVVAFANKAGADIQDVLGDVGDYLTMRTPLQRQQARDVSTAPRAIATALGAKTAPKPKPKKKATTAATDRATIVKAIEQGLASGPFAQLESATAAEFLPAYQTAMSYASGAQGPAATQGAFSAALAALPSSTAVLGQNPGSWLSEALSAGQAVEQPLTQAMAAYGAAEAKQLPSILAGVQAAGQGMEAGVAYAQEGAWTQALTSHINSLLGYYGEVPTAALATMPSSIAKALQLSGSETGTGLTPVADITTRGLYARPKTGTAGQPLVPGTPTTTGATATQGSGGSTVRP